MYRREKVDFVCVCGGGGGVKTEIEVRLPIFDKICPQQNQRRCHVSVCLVISEVFVTGKWTAR